MKNITLTYDFYNQHVTIVAKMLLGKIIVFNNLQSIITETEAYRGYDDPASHAFRGRTMRCNIMFDHPGKLYVYLIYGKYYCCNITAEPLGQPAAVLLRGIKLFNNKTITGPGKISKYLNINKTHNGISLIKNSDIYIADAMNVKNFFSTPRIGISKALNKLWRYYY